AEERDEAERDQYVGERIEQVDRAHQETAEPAARVGRDRTDRNAAGEPDADGDDADVQRQPGAEQDAAQNIAAELVGAQPVSDARRREPAAGADLVRAERRDIGRAE